MSKLYFVFRYTADTFGVTLNNRGVPWEVAREVRPGGGVGAGEVSVLTRAGLGALAEGRPCQFRFGDVFRYIPSALKSMNPDPVTEDVSFL